MIGSLPCRENDRGPYSRKSKMENEEIPALWACACC